MPGYLIEAPVLLTVVGVLHRVAMSYGDQGIAWFTYGGPSIPGTAMFCICPFFWKYLLCEITLRRV